MECKKTGLVEEVTSAIKEVETEGGSSGPFYIYIDDLNYKVSITVAKFDNDLDIAIGIPGSEENMRPDFRSGDCSRHPYEIDDLIRKGPTEIMESSFGEYYRKEILPSVSNALNVSLVKIKSSIDEEPKCMWVEKNNIQTEKEFTGYFTITLKNILSEKERQRRTSGY